MAICSAAGGLDRAPAFLVEQPANTKAFAWKYDIRSAHWPNVKTLGDVVREAARRTKLQVATPPIIDLSQIYGPQIS